MKNIIVYAYSWRRILRASVSGSKCSIIIAALLYAILTVNANAQSTQCVSTATAGGTADALTVPLLPCSTTTTILLLTLTATNTVSTPTLQMAGSPALTIKRANGTAVGVGELTSGAVILLTNTGSEWRKIDSAIGGLMLTDGSNAVSRTGTGALVFATTPSISSVTLTGTTSLTGTLLSTYSSYNIRPASNATAGFQITSNYEADGAVDYWSTVNAAGAQGHAWWQKLTNTTEKKMAFLYGDATFSEYDVVNGTVLATLGATSSAGYVGTNSNHPLNFFINALSVGSIATTGRWEINGALQIGTTTDLTLAAGEFGLAKITASGTAPGAAGGKIALVCGTNAGTAKLVAYAGTSVTATTILDNIGSGVTGC